MVYNFFKSNQSNEHNDSLDIDLIKVMNLAIISNEIYVFYLICNDKRNDFKFDNKDFINSTIIIGNNRFLNELYNSIYDDNIACTFECFKNFK